jgi:hypothetical protein
MRAVGTRMRHDVGKAIEQKRGALVLNQRCERLGAIDERALICGSKPQQHRRHVGAFDCSRERVPNGGGISHLRGHDIEARGGAPGFGPVASGRHR